MSRSGDEASGLPGIEIDHAIDQRSIRVGQIHERHALCARAPHRGSSWRGFEPAFPLCDRLAHPISERDALFGDRAVWLIVTRDTARPRLEPEILAIEDA
jgi:hypothetical protein